ncbi:hypothetical protein HDU76_003661 [Blyttiomyces sp. JEL0837]|nr:hypothetical protein HDU76_003661 [Blyttiomyces sp. JEL0837]
MLGRDHPAVSVPSKKTFKKLVRIHDKIVQAGGQSPFKAPGSFRAFLSHNLRRLELMDLLLEKDTTQSERHKINILEGAKMVANIKKRLETSPTGLISGKDCNLAVALDAAASFLARFKKVSDDKASVKGVSAAQTPRRAMDGNPFLENDAASTGSVDDLPESTFPAFEDYMIENETGPDMSVSDIDVTVDDNALPTNDVEIYGHCNNKDIQEATVDHDGSHPDETVLPTSELGQVANNALVQTTQEIERQTITAPFETRRCPSVDDDSSEVAIDQNLAPAFAPNTRDLNNEFAQLTSANANFKVQVDGYQSVIAELVHDVSKKNNIIEEKDRWIAKQAGSIRKLREKVARLVEGGSDEGEGFRAQANGFGGHAASQQILDLQKQLNAALEFVEQQNKVIDSQDERIANLKDELSAQAETVKHLEMVNADLLRKQKPSRLPRLIKVLQQPSFASSNTFGALQLLSPTTPFHSQRMLCSVGSTSQNTSTTTSAPNSSLGQIGSYEYFWHTSRNLRQQLALTSPLAPGAPDCLKKSALVTPVTQGMRSTFDDNDLTLETPPLPSQPPQKPTPMISGGSPKFSKVCSVTSLADDQSTPLKDIILRERPVPAPRPQKPEPMISAPSTPKGPNVFSMEPLEGTRALGSNNSISQTSQLQSCSNAALGNALHQTIKQKLRASPQPPVITTAVLEEPMLPSRRVAYTQNVHKNAPENTAEVSAPISEKDAVKAEIDRVRANVKRDKKLKWCEGRMRQRKALFDSDYEALIRDHMGAGCVLSQAQVDYLKAVERARSVGVGAVKTRQVLKVRGGGNIGLKAGKTAELKVNVSGGNHAVGGRKGKIGGLLGLDPALWSQRREKQRIRTPQFPAMPFIALQSINAKEGLEKAGVSKHGCRPTV